jgi:hypothetical protein
MAEGKWVSYLRVVDLAERLEPLLEIAYERRAKPALFRLDIDNVLILSIHAHLAQELLKLAAALSSYLALKLCQRFINCLRRGHRAFDIGLNSNDASQHQQTSLGTHQVCLTVYLPMILQVGYVSSRKRPHVCRVAPQHMGRSVVGWDGNNFLVFSLWHYINPLMTRPLK